MIGEYERKRKYALDSKTLKSHVSIVSQRHCRSVHLSKGDVRETLRRLYEPYEFRMIK